MYKVDYSGRISYVSNYFYGYLWPEGLLRDAECTC